MNDHDLDRDAGPDREPGEEKTLSVDEAVTPERGPLPAADPDIVAPEPLDPAASDAPEASPPPLPETPSLEPPSHILPPNVLGPKSGRRPGWVGALLRRVALALFLLLVAGPVVVTLIYRVVPPPLTALMVLRAVQGNGLDHRWRSLDRISPALARAVVAAEDARFCEHHGFDFEAMRKALANNERRPGRVRGGSTISQQTAKNVFLWPDRSYVRKGFEAWFTVLIETLWGKRRIMEVYLNSVEWGPGVYGAQAAARRNFRVDADALSPAQAARLAAILPSPLKWRAAAPGPYVARRSRRIGAASGAVTRDGLDDCLRRGAARRG